MLDFIYYIANTQVPCTWTFIRRIKLLSTKWSGLLESNIIQKKLSILIRKPIVLTTVHFPSRPSYGLGFIPNCACYYNVHIKFMSCRFRILKNIMGTSGTEACLQFCPTTGHRSISLSYFQATIGKCYGLIYQFKVNRMKGDFK